MSRLMIKCTEDAVLHKTDGTILIKHVFDYFWRFKHTDMMKFKHRES